MLELQVPGFSERSRSNLNVCYDLRPFFVFLSTPLLFFYVLRLVYGRKRALHILVFTIWESNNRCEVWQGAVFRQREVCHVVYKLNEHYRQYNYNT